MTMLKVSSPAELISAVPFLLGFHPVDSLTVVAMHGPRITFAVRADLPERDTSDEKATAVVLHLATVVLRQQVEAVALIGYGEESRVTPAVLRASDVFGKAGLDIVDELRVADGRFWSYLCTDRSCCPAEGQPCQPPDSVVAAEATFAGAVALPNREALEAQLTPVTGDDREAMTVATARALLRLAALASDCPPAPESPPHRADGDPPVGQPPTERGAGEGTAGSTQSNPSIDRPGPVDVASPGGSGAGPIDLRFPTHVTNLHGFSAAGGSAAEASAAGASAAEASAAEASAADASAAGGSAAGGSAPGENAAHGSQMAHGPKVPRAGTGSSGPGPAELHLGRMISAGLGVAPSLPDAPGPGTGGVDLLADEDYFVARVRSAGRLAVREAERCYSTGGRLTDDAAAWLGVLLLHMPVRDYAWTRTRTQEWELALWSDLARRVEPRYLPAPAALLAFVAWRSGMGPLASIAVERTLAQKPDYALAVLLHRALVIGLPPSVLDGWPAVEGLALSDDWPGPEQDAPPGEAVSFEQPRGSAPDRPTPTAPPGGDPGRPQPAGQSGHEPVAREKTQSGRPGETRPAQPEPASRPVEREPASRPAGPEPDQRTGREKAPSAEQGGPQPMRSRSDAPSAGPRQGAGERPDRRAKRQPKPRRTAHRRT